LPRAFGFLRFFLAWMASTLRLTSVLELILNVFADSGRRQPRCQESSRPAVQHWTDGRKK
jgi:hypothetical protein